jgi:hypothetical protein
MLTGVSLAQQVTLFADCNFRGYSVNLGPGNYTSSQHRFPLRELSSINIPPGMVVNIFSQDFFNGHYITLNQSSTCLLNQHFNDQMVSIQVLSTGFVNQVFDAPVVLYNRCNFSGSQEPLQEGVYNNINMGFVTIQSIRVAPGFGIIVRKETGYGQNVTVTNEEFRSDQSCLRILWGAAIKSIFVYRLGNVHAGHWGQVPTQPQAIQQFQQGAVVYTEPFYRGRTQILYPGAYRGYQLDQVGESSISSIMLAQGYRAIGFSGSNFDGASVVINSSNNNLHAGFPSWGNRIRSVIIERLGHQPTVIQPVIQPPPPPPPVINNNPNAVVMYADANFRGAAQQFPIGNYRGFQLNVVGQRTISSVSIPPGLKVIAYEGPEFNGASREILTSVNNLVQEGMGWNDRISSFTVQRNTGQPAVIGRPEPMPTGGRPEPMPTGGRPEPMPTGGRPEPMPPGRPQPANSNQPSGVMIYSDAYFAGPAQQLMMGHTNGNQLTMVPAGTISSIKIPPGFKVTVYEGFNFDGDYRILNYTIDNFAAEGQGKWNKRIHSFIVERAQ